MRKLILLFSALLIIIALGGPALTGHYAEKIVRDGQPLVVQGLPDWLALVEHSYERGWFRSNASHRFLVTDPARAGALASWLSEGDFGDQPAIIMDSTITHGLLISLLKPGLARVSSRFVVDGGNASKGVPATVVTDVALDGQTRFTANLTDGGWGNAGAAFEWDRVQVQYAPNPQSMSSVDVIIEAQSLSYTSSEDHAFVLEDVNARVSMIADGNKIRSTLRYTGEVTGQPKSSQGELLGELKLDDFSVESFSAMQRIKRAIDESRVSGEQAAMAALDQDAGMLRAGFATPTLTAWEHTLTTNDGAQTILMKITTPGLNDMPVAANSQALMSYLVERSDVAVDASTSASYLNGIAATNPAIGEQITMMKGVGALVGNDADGYTMQATASQGVVTLNGMQLPTMQPTPSQ